MGRSRAQGIPWPKVASTVRLLPAPRSCSTNDCIFILFRLSARRDPIHTLLPKTVPNRYPIAWRPARDVDSPPAALDPPRPAGIRSPWIRIQPGWLPSPNIAARPYPLGLHFETNLVALQSVITAFPNAAKRGKQVGGSDALEKIVRGKCVARRFQSFFGWMPCNEYESGASFRSQKAQRLAVLRRKGRLIDQRYIGRMFCKKSNRRAD